MRIIETRQVRDTNGNYKSSYLPKSEDTPEVVGFAYECKKGALDWE